MHELLPAENAPLVKMILEQPALFLFLILSAPFFETFIGQWLPIWFFGLFTRATWAKVLLSAIVFAALHLGNSPANALIILLLPGPVFAYTFIRWREHSRTKAYFATTFTHVVHNLVPGLLALTMA
ncbi:MAG: CPBP family intramembrane metalloprotease [Planctomycetes bacterium]|nr:CPBP family intramembrane metalloprotease [Planctomycetota bacterium]